MSLEDSHFNISAEGRIRVSLRQMKVKGRFLEWELEGDVPGLISVATKPVSLRGTTFILSGQSYACRLVQGSDWTHSWGPVAGLDSELLVSYLGSGDNTHLTRQLYD